MLKKLGCLMLGLFLVSVGTSYTAAQGEGTEDLKLAFGTVVSIGSSEIVISESDDIDGTQTNVAYAIGDETSTEVEGGLDSIKAGDDVEIFYEEVGGKKVAKYIAPDMIEEDLPEEEYDSSEDEEDLTDYLGIPEE